MIQMIAMTNKNIGKYIMANKWKSRGNKFLKKASM